MFQRPNIPEPQLLPWWAIGIRGASAFAFGVMAFAWPDISLLTLVVLFGAFCLPAWPQSQPRWQAGSFAT